MMFCGNPILAVNFIVMTYFKVIHPTFVMMFHKHQLMKGNISVCIQQCARERCFPSSRSASISNYEYKDKNRLNIVEGKMRSKRGLK